MKRPAVAALFGFAILVAIFVLLRGRQPQTPTQSSSPTPESLRTATPVVMVPPLAADAAAGVSPKTAAVVAAKPAAVAEPQTVDDRAKAILAAGMAGQGGDPAGDPRSVARLLEAYSKEELDLVALLNRAGASSPPALKGLFELRRRGGSSDDQRRYVRANLGGDSALRFVALKWIDDHDPNSVPDQPLPPPAGGRGPELGSVEQVTRTPAQGK